MDVDANVALVAEHGLTGVQTHAHTDGPALERVASLGGRGQRFRGLRKRDEERVALSIDLYPTVPLECMTERPPMLAEHLGVAAAELVQQLRRTFDVREQEGDGPGRELAHTADDAPT